MTTAHKANRLVDSTSPYLLQHAYNPVDWYPWSAEAIQKAKTENKPIFLSIGYSACHWCHVMEREVFENENIAAYMNDHFVNIKVDREERPDLDELYMLATQLMSGSGGWPMSVWLTPDLEPFYAGTYFPPVDMQGRPGFPRIEAALVDAWKNKNASLMEQAKKVVAAIQQHANETAAGTTSNGDINVGEWISAATQNSSDSFDSIHGGIGTAPKFPPHQSLALWLTMLRELPAKAQGNVRDGLSNIETMLTKTLDGMANGGIYDHLAGGFARYSTDEKWLVPHFEKMLYDNAQLAPIYAEASVLLHNPHYARIARGTLDFWLREMTGPDGEFYSTLDADSEGEEGKFYVWSMQDLRDAIPDLDDRNLLIAHFGLTEQGNWHESPVPGGSVLAISHPMDDKRERLDQLLVDLRKVRSGRTWPSLDDKVLTSWNALMIAALARTGHLLSEPRYIDAARKSLAFLTARHLQNENLLRVSRKDNPAHTPAFLEDYAYLLSALTELIDATTDFSLTDLAEALATNLLANFEDKSHGGFFFTGPQNEQLFTRMKTSADNATPSPNGIAIRALLKLARITGEEKYRDAALRAVSAFAPHIERRPEYFPTILNALLDDAEEQPTSALAPETPITTGPLSLLPIDEIRSAPGKGFMVTLELDIAPGYHIQAATGVDDGLHPTSAKIRADAIQLSTQDLAYPDTQVIDHDQLGYTGRLEIIASCSLPKTTPPGRYILRAIVNAQPCSGTACQEPQTLAVEFSLIVT